MATPGSLAEVIARMQSTLGPLPKGDGVACFTRLYLSVTEGVQERLAGFVFADPAFLSRLDVIFAGLFFTALDEASAKGAHGVPHAWAPLVEERSAHGIAPLQFALAGMSAHINRDLPVALVTTCTELGIELEEGSPQHRDFEHVNTVLADVEARVKAEYLTGVLHTLDRLIHRVDRIDDVVAMWNVSRARDAAWANAQALWALRGQPELEASYLAALDRMVGLTCRGLLVPADTWLQRLARALD
ncbi:MAG: DUF5995 family protein [Gaiellaceae bacterium]